MEAGGGSVCAIFVAGDYAISWPIACCEGGRLVGLYTQIVVVVLKVRVVSSRAHAKAKKTKLVKERDATAGWSGLGLKPPWTIFKQSKCPWYHEWQQL